MSHNDTQNRHDGLARRQLRLFDDLGTTAGLTAEQRRRLLALSDPEWAAWMRFMRDGPLPTQPKLPEMLLRIGTALYRLTLMTGDDRVPADATGW